MSQTHFAFVVLRLCRFNLDLYLGVNTAQSTTTNVVYALFWMTLKRYATHIQYGKKRPLEEIKDLVVCQWFQVDSGNFGGNSDRLTSDEFHLNMLEKVE